jgi:hypothetical protein
MVRKQAVADQIVAAGRLPVADHEVVVMENDLEFTRFALHISIPGKN